LSAGITTRFFDQASGIQYLNFSIGQIYYFKDREVFLPPDLPGVDRQASYSPLFGQLAVSPNKAIRATASLEWEPGNGRTGRGHVSLQYAPDHMHILNMTYRYTNKDVHTVNRFENIEASDITVIWPIKGKLSAIGRWNFGWDNDQTIESFAGIEYNDCCWRTRLVFRRFLKDPRTLTLFEEDPASPGGVRQVSFVDHRADTGVFFEFQLKGLATMGRRLDSLLDDAIIGYREREDHLEN